MSFDNDYNDYNDCDRLIEDILAQMEDSEDGSVIYIDGNDYDIPGLNELLLAMTELMMENEDYADACFVDGDSLLVDFTELSGEAFRDLKSGAAAMLSLDEDYRNGKPHYLS